MPSIALGDHELKAIPDSDENLTGSDCVLILTDHPDFDYARAARLATLIVDARNATWGITAAGDHVVRL